MKTKQFLTIMPSIIRATDKVLFAMKSQVAPILAGTMLAVTGTAFAASALTPAATTPNKFSKTKNCYSHTTDKWRLFMLR